MSEQRFNTRIVGSGTNAVGAGATVTLLTFTRKAGERVWPAAFISTNTAGEDIGWSFNGSNSINLQLLKTANANEMQLVAISSAGGSLTVDWALLGMIP